MIAQYYISWVYRSIIMSWEYFEKNIYLLIENKEKTRILLPNTIDELVKMTLIVEQDIFLTKLIVIEEYIRYHGCCIVVRSNGDNSSSHVQKSIHNFTFN